MPRNLDVDAQTREALKFERLLEHVAGFAQLPMGREATLALEPLAELEPLQESLELVGEVSELLEAGTRLVRGQAIDPRPLLPSLAVTGFMLEPKPLRELAAVVALASTLGRDLRRLGQERPRLVAVGQQCPDLTDDTAEILRCIDPEGGLTDDSSPELARLRQSRLRLTDRLQQTLQRRLRDPGTESVIQDEFITQRNGRYVIPVRTDSPRQVRGIVHASSSSGATRFIEPMETVPLNNELVQLAEAEQQEVQRLLLQWTARLAQRREEIELALELLALVDCAQARARFGEDLAGILPEVVAGDWNARSSSLRLIELRHPLLELQLREEGHSAVPLRLTLEPADQILVVSGPNTGGKTVALKTVGLAVLMAQAGIPLPAVAARLPIYRQVRADIGDHQSIQANLSTFSAHIRMIADSLEAAAPPALFLFDEIGSGTDPGEGAALAQAILEHLLPIRGMTVLATTHQELLKSWALTTDGALTAAMEFDPQTLTPSYRLLLGSAGESAGLAIAERLGLPPSLVDQARRSLGPDHGRLQQLMGRIQELVDELEQERAALVEQRESLVAQQRELQALAAAREARRIDDARKTLEAAVADLKQRATDSLNALAGTSGVQGRAARQRKVASFADKLNQQTERVLREIGGKGAEPTSDAKLTPTVGRRAFVRSLGQVGEIIRVEGERIEVGVGSFQISTTADDLLPPQSDSSEPKRRTPRRLSRAQGLQQDPGSASDLDQAGSELKLIGMRVEPAMELLDRYIDRAVLAGYQQLRIIHGHGTGRLRTAVREFLKRHAQVASATPGKSYEGGDGATVVKLR